MFFHPHYFNFVPKNAPWSILYISLSIREYFFRMYFFNALMTFLIQLALDTLHILRIVFECKNYLGIFCSIFRPVQWHCLYLQTSLRYFTGIYIKSEIHHRVSPKNTYMYSYNASKVKK